jgi:hypothetical protein
MMVVIGSAGQTLADATAAPWRQCSLTETGCVRLVSPALLIAS